MNTVNYPTTNPDPSWAASSYANSTQQTATKKTQEQKPEDQSSQKKTTAVQERSLTIREDRVTITTQSAKAEIVPAPKETQELAVVKKTSATYDASARLAATTYEEKSTPSPQQPRLIDFYA